MENRLMVKNRARIILAVIGLIVSSFLANIAFAEIKTFIQEYTYIASDIDSKASSRAIALEQVKRALLEQLGTYLISETKVINFHVTKDQITTLTAGIVSAEVIEEKWDGRSYYLKAKITADPEEAARSVDTLKNDLQKSKELEDSKKKAEEAMREVERLKKEMNSSKGDTNKQREYANAIKDLSTSDWFDKGLAFHKSNNFENAIDAYTKAIELNPKYTDAYYSRGTAYDDFGNYDQAVNDYSKAIELNPKFEVIYLLRGYAYFNLKNFQSAINDYNKAIALNPADAKAYYFRGLANGMLGNNTKSIQDFKIAARLGLTEVQKYLNSERIEWQ